MEAEFYYRVIARDLGKDTSHWERKAHIFIFESPEDWKLFQTKANLDPWTGGIHANNELFIQRDPTYKFKGWTLGHETAHLVMNRFFGANVPLWLNEGYAEYIARVAYASFFRARGFDAHPRTGILTAECFIPVVQLANMLSYPAEVPRVLAFYVESEKLVRFLSAADKTKFLTFSITSRKAVCSRTPCTTPTAPASPLRICWRRSSAPSPSKPPLSPPPTPVPARSCRTPLNSPPDLPFPGSAFRPIFYLLSPISISLPFLLPSARGHQTRRRQIIVQIRQHHRRHR